MKLVPDIPGKQPGHPQGTGLQSSEEGILNFTADLSPGRRQTPESVLAEAGPALGVAAHGRQAKSSRFRAGQNSDTESFVFDRVSALRPPVKGARSKRQAGDPATSARRRSPPTSAQHKARGDGVAESRAH